MKIVKALPFLAMGTMALGLVGVTVLAPVANAETQSNTVLQTVKLVVDKEIGIDADTFGQGTVEGSKAKNDATGNTDDKHDTAQGTGLAVTYKGNVPGRITLTDNDEDTDLKNAADSTAAGIPTVADTTTASKGWNAVVKVTKAGQQDTTKTFAMPKKSDAPIVLVEAKKEDLKTVDRAKAETKFNFKKDATVAPGTYTDEVVYTVAADDTAAAPVAGAATTPVTNPQH